MVGENDWRELLIDDEAKRWRAQKIAPPYGYLYDWDDDRRFVFSNYDPLIAAPYWGELGEKSATVAGGVAVFKVADFRAAVEKKEKSRVTGLFRRVDSGEKLGARWHIKAACAPARLLLRRPTTPDSER